MPTQLTFPVFFILIDPSFLLSEGLAFIIIFVIQFCWRWILNFAFLNRLLLLPFFFFFWAPTHAAYEVPGLRVKSELQLHTYTRAMATVDPSHICDPCCSMQQCQILNPLSRSGIEPTSSWTLCQVLSHWATAGTPLLCFYLFIMYLCIYLFIFWSFLGSLPWHMEVPRLGF